MKKSYTAHPGSGDDEREERGPMGGVMTSNIDEGTIGLWIPSHEHNDPEKAKED